MLKFVAVAVAVAFSVGMAVGLNAMPDSTPSVGQGLSNAVPANAGIPQSPNTSWAAMTSAEKSDAEIALLKVLERKIAKSNEKYEALISEIARLQTIKATLEEELGETVLVPGVTPGQ